MPHRLERGESEEDIDEEDEEEFGTDSELSDRDYHDRQYSMGPILRAMVSEWDKGDELLVSESKHKL